MSVGQDSDFSLEVSGLGKAYRIWRDPAARLKAPIWDALAGICPRFAQPKWLLQRRIRPEGSRYFKEFHALKNVSFRVRRGEAVGIVGRNGSGKSTLLQLIAGTLTPSTGWARVSGRVAALLELGSGFNPEFTGRENVYLNARILGLTRAETDERYAAITEFAEIGDFIDQPVRTYSSGMVVRLAFAVAAHVEPEILIVDEALSVGDARFQLKCARSIDRFIEKGTTLLFVSHDASLVKRLCQRALLMERGELLYEGNPNDVINLYSKLTAEGAGDITKEIAALKSRSAVCENATNATSDNSLSLAPTADLARREIIDDERAHIPASGREFAYGGEAGSILSITPKDALGRFRLHFTSGDEVAVHMVAETKTDVDAPIFALTLKNTAGVEIYGTNTLFNGQPAPPMRAGQRAEAVFRFPLNVMPGEYFLSFGFVHFVDDRLTVIQRRYDALKLEITAKDRAFGIANLHARIDSRLLPAR